MRLDAGELGQALKLRIAPVYLVSGDEPLLVGEATDAIRAAARAAGYAERQVFFCDRGFAWDEFRQATQSLSLFAERRFFDLRLPSGKPEKGAAVLLDICMRPPPDVVCLVSTGKLDRKASEVPWVRAFEKHGVWVATSTVASAALPGWLRARAAALGVALEPDAAQLIVDRVEGNLLAAQQELEKLALLSTDRCIGAPLVRHSVGNSARYDVYQLGEAAAAGDARRTLHILLGLKGEGAEPTLILWALVRELRGLFQARERARLKSAGRGGWSQAATPSAAAEGRLKGMPLAALLRQAHHADRVVKGLAGGDPWTALTGLAAAIAGALQATVDSGRVAS